MSTRKLCVLLSLTIIAASALGAYVFASGNARPADGGSPVGQGRPNRPGAEPLPVMLRAGGFVPREISRPAGDYVLSVNDQSRTPGLELRLERENGGRMHEAKLSRRNPYWRQLFRLTPGTYLITEANHPEWVCRITITAD